MYRQRHFREIINGPAHVLYHVGMIVLSASIALSLPYTADFVARRSLILWASIGNEKIFMTAVEIVLAVVLILLFGYVGRNWRNRRLSRMAKKAGLVMGSTGFSTFVEEKSDLHSVIKNCRTAKIMLLNPYGEKAGLRAKSILDPDITIGQSREQTWKSIDFLKRLRADRKDIRLKLYDEYPFLKLTISSDYVWVKHYHAEFDIQVMPEYVFKYNQDPGSLYVPFYQYFLKKWNDRSIPEYDLKTDELVFRDQAGREEKREKFTGLNG